MREPENPEEPFIVAGHLFEGDEEENTHLSLVISSSSIIDKILHDPVDKGLHIDYTHGLSTGIYYTILRLIFNVFAAKYNEFAFVTVTLC